MIPVFFDQSKEEIQNTLDLLNGVLMTGGGTDISLPDTNLLTPYGEAV